MTSGLMHARPPRTRRKSRRCLVCFSVSLWLSTITILVATAPLASAFGQTTITVWVQGTVTAKAQKAALQEAASILNAATLAKPIVLEFEDKPAASDLEAVKQIQIQLVNDPKAYDIYLAPQLALGMMAANCNAADLQSLLQDPFPGAGDSLDKLLLDDTMPTLWPGLTFTKTCNGGGSTSPHRYAIPADWNMRLMFFSRPMLEDELKAEASAGPGAGCMMPPLGAPNQRIAHFQAGIVSGDITFEMVLCLAQKAYDTALAAGRSLDGMVINKDSLEDWLLITRAADIEPLNGDGDYLLDRSKFYDLLKTLQGKLIDKAKSAPLAPQAAGDMAAIMPYYSGGSGPCDKSANDPAVCAFVKLDSADDMVPQQKLIGDYWSNVVWTHIPRFATGTRGRNLITSAIWIVNPDKPNSAVSTLLIALAVAQQRKLKDDDAFKHRFGVYKSDSFIESYRGRHDMSMALDLFDKIVDPNTPLHVPCDAHMQDYLVVMRHALSQLTASSDLTILTQDTGDAVDALQASHMSCGS